MPTIVSVTPVPLERDSRTIKMAATFANAGYRSVVIESKPSIAPDFTVPFELRTIPTHLTERKSVSRSVATAGNRSDQNDSPPMWKTSLVNALLAAGLIRDQGVRCFRAIPPASLYYLHAPYQFLPVLARSWIHHAPFIYDAHDFYPGIIPQGKLTAYHRHYVVPFFTGLEQRCVRAASSVVTVSEGVAHLMYKQFGVNPQVIRNCHDSRRDITNSPCLKARIGINSEDFLIIVIGNCKPGQSILKLLQALTNQPKSVHVAFLGRHYEFYLSDIDSLGLAHRVHLLGAVLPSEIVPTARGADAAAILYYPHSENYRHCLPNGFFQSVAAELPLLYPPLPEIQDLAERYNIGICVDPFSVDSIRRGLSILFAKGAAYQTYGHNLKRAAQELSWEQEEKVFLKIVEQCLGSPRNRGVRLS